MKRTAAALCAGAFVCICAGPAAAEYRWQRVEPDAEIISDAAGGEREIQFNVGGAMDADALFVFDAAGNLGVGTATPVTKAGILGSLHIADGGETCSGNAAMEGAIRYVAASDAFQVCASAATGWTALTTGTAPGTAAGSDRQIQFNVGDTFAADANFVFDGAGNLGVGTTSPAAPLDIGGHVLIDKGKGNVGVGPDILMTANAVIAAESSLYINIDSNNDSTGAALMIEKDAETSAGTRLFTVNEDGSATLEGTMRADGGFEVDGRDMISATGAVHTAQMTDDTHYGYFEALNNSGQRAFYLGWGNGGSEVDLKLDQASILDISGGRVNLPTTYFNVGRGDVYIENNANDNADGAGITLRTSSNPSSGSIFSVRSSGEAVRLWVGQSRTGTANADFHVGIGTDGSGGTPVWHAGNDGSGSGLDADTLDGWNLTTASTANTVVGRNGSGDINARLFRSEYDTTNASINYIMTQIDTASNNYIRPSTPAQFRAAVTDGVYLPIAGKAADSSLINGIDLRVPTGNYGSIAVMSSGQGGYEGYSINNRYVLMSNDNTRVGLYNDLDNNWMIQALRNTYLYLYYNGSWRLRTESGGIGVNGTVTASNPTANSHLATKSYVDNAVAAAGGGPPTGCPNVGDVCDDGTVYAGNSPDSSLSTTGSTKMYALPIRIGRFAWGSHYYNDSGPHEATDLSTTTGKANTAAIAAFSPAGSVCANLEAFGRSDWYLPAKDELNVLYTNIGLPNNSWFWSSSEDSYFTAWVQHADGRPAAVHAKDDIRSVRCVRRD